MPDAPAPAAGGAPDAAAEAAGQKAVATAEAIRVEVAAAEKPEDLVALKAELEKLRAAASRGELARMSEDTSQALMREIRALQVEMVRKRRSYLPW